MKDNTKTFILLGIVIVIEIVFFFLMNKITSINPDVIIFDLRLFYSPTVFYNNIQIYNAEIEMYLMIFRIIDVIFPVAYSLLLIQLLKNLGSSHKILPLIALVFDLLENILLSYKIFHHSYSGDFIVYLINTFTITKFIAIIFSIIMIVIIVIRKRRMIL